MDREEDRKDHAQGLIIETPRPRGLGINLESL